MGCGASREHAGPAPGALPLAVETAEQRAAKLAELRRLTPEQAAAAAKAAQRIEEVAAAVPHSQLQTQVLKDPEGTKVYSITRNTGGRGLCSVVSLLVCVGRVSALQYSRHASRVHGHQSPLCAR